jgi:hypothetical protein
METSEEKTLALPISRGVALKREGWGAVLMFAVLAVGSFALSYWLFGPLLHVKAVDLTHMSDNGVTEA